MGKLLIWFSILYGNLVALVGLAGVVVWWTSRADGQQFCADVGLTLTACRSGLLVVDVVVMGYATIVSLRRLSVERRNLESKQGKSDKTHES